MKEFTEKLVVLIGYDLDWIFDYYKANTTGGYSVYVFPESGKHPKEQLKFLIRNYMIWEKHHLDVCFVLMEHILRKILIDFNVWQCRIHRFTDFA